MAKTAGIKRVESDVTDSSGAFSFVDITDLSLPVLISQYYLLEYFLFMTTAATTTSVEVDLGSTTPSTAPTLLAGVVETPITTTDSADSVWEAPFNAIAEAAVNPVTLSATAGNLVRMVALYQPSVSQIIIPRFATEIDTSAVVVKAGLSHLRWREL